MPELVRKSSGSSGLTNNLTKLLNDTNLFSEVIFLETEYFLNFEKSRYLGAWHSTNDIQAQAGVARWKKIIDMIEKETINMDIIPIPYKSRAWTAYLDI